MRTDETETHEETDAEAPVQAVASFGGDTKPAPEATVEGGDFVPGVDGGAPTATPILAKSHDPQCERCDDPAVQSDPPTTSTAAFRKGFCTSCTPKKTDGKTEAKPAVSSVKRTIEHWAKAKGMLPRILEQGKVEQTGRLVPARQNPKFADFHRARQGLPVGHEMTEQEFDARVVAATQHAFR